MSSLLGMPLYGFLNGPYIFLCGEREEVPIDKENRMVIIPSDIKI